MKNSQFNNLTIEQFNNKNRGFTLLEVLVAIAVFTLVMAAGGGTFHSIQQAWRKQKATVNLVQNSRWAMEFMTNQVRHSTITLNPPQYPPWARIQIQVAGQRLQFGIDADGNGAVDTQIQFQRQGTVFQMRQRPNGVGPWGAWQELANFVVNNPNNPPKYPDLVNNTTGLPPRDNLMDPTFILYNGLLTIELTLRPTPTAPLGPGNRDYTVITQARPRN